MARGSRSTPARAGHRGEPQSTGGQAPNPVWFKPVMFGFLLLGLVWILVYYISGGTLPVSGIAAWNIAIGFGIAFVGFLMTLRWR